MEKPRVRQSADGLYNVVSGLGTEKAKTMHNQFALDVLSNNYQQLDAAYQSNWIARNIVDVPAEDMTREWRTIKSDKAEEIALEESRLGLQEAVLEAIKWARLYGGGMILMITGQDLGKPLNVKAVKKGGLEKLIVFDRWDLGHNQINMVDPIADNFLLPEFYTIQGGSQPIHWSHFARFTGDQLPRRILRQTHGWGDSILRKCLKDVKDIVSSKDGIAELMQEANIDVITRQGLSDELASDQDDAIQARYALYSQMKSIVNMALLDGEETFQRLTLNLGGVAPILDNFMIWLAGAAGMPCTKLFGMSPAGLNSTGESDLANYYDLVRSKQHSQLMPGLRRLDEVIVRSALGEMPADFDWEFNPLKQIDALQLSQSRLIDAQRHQLYMDYSVIEPAQVKAELQASEVYQFTDEQLEPDELIEIDEPESDDAVE